MKDEEYVLQQENREKAITARSARNKRTHCGRGGRVKLPSDYMTKKELNAMNGKCETYRLNEPMKWDEFKKMPDDIKVTYIKLIREKFNTPDAEIAVMLGVHKVTMAKEMARLKIGKGKTPVGSRKWDKEGYLKWLHGVPTEQPETANEPVDAVEEMVDCEDAKTIHIPMVAPYASCLPQMGSMDFEGNVDEICNTIRTLLRGSHVKLSVVWKVLEVEHG